MREMQIYPNNINYNLNFNGQVRTLIIISVKKTKELSFNSFISNRSNVLKQSKYITKRITCINRARY